MRQQKDTNNTTRWPVYEAILDNVYFEWDDHLHIGQQKCKEDCIEYLKTYFPNFRMRKFYLKNEAAIEQKNGPQKAQDPAQSTLPGANEF